ncbi:MAG: hypothetical protein N2439_17935, partial [Anaerolineae bacterium]|nr:hypothetical protein [Anaerolineae bacterium]
MSRHNAVLAAGIGAILLIGLALSMALTATAASYPASALGAIDARPAAFFHQASGPTAVVQAGSYYSVPFASPWIPPAPAYRIAIAADGIQRLDYAALAAAGLPVDTLDPRTFRMFYMGQEIAIRVNGEADGRFDAGDEILFYARTVDSLFYEGLLRANKYTGTNIFWLTYGGPSGRRMAQLDGSAGGAPPPPFLHKEHLERYTRYVYLNNYPDLPDADHWFDVKLVAPNSRTYTFQ